MILRCTQETTPSTEGGAPGCTAHGTLRANDFQSEVADCEPPKSPAVLLINCALAVVEELMRGTEFLMLLEVVAAENCSRLRNPERE